MISVLLMSRGNVSLKILSVNKCLKPHPVVADRTSRGLDANVTRCVPDISVPERRGVIVAVSADD